jgi:hypothetical protein
MAWKYGHAKEVETLEHDYQKDDIVPGNGRTSSNSKQSETYQGKKTFIYF